MYWYVYFLYTLIGSVFCVCSKQNVDHQTRPQGRGHQHDSDYDFSPERTGHKSHRYEVVLLVINQCCIG